MRFGAQSGTEPQRASLMLLLDGSQFQRKEICGLIYDSVVFVCPIESAVKNRKNTTASRLWRGVIVILDAEREL